MNKASLRGSRLAFGKYGLKSQASAWVTSRQIEAARRAITRQLQRGGQLWIRIFPHKPVTTSAAETPMGGGKGTLDHFVAVVEAGKIILEIDGISEALAKESLRLAARKFPMKTKIIIGD